MTERIQFQSDTYTLEGLLRHNKEEQAAVITHPHPLYGGDMNNVVVEAISNAYYKKRHASLRFNFRGVGKSQGKHEDGIGEQKDVRAAIGYMADRGFNQIDLVGYSFGAWVNAHIDCEAAGVRRMIMVSPPVNFMSFDDIGPLPQLELVVVGDDDEFASIDLIKEMLPRLNPKAKLVVIDRTDHFYRVTNRELEKIIEAVLEPV